MTEERDIAGFALPFATGIISAGILSRTSPSAASSISILLTTVSVMTLMHPFHKRWNSHFLTGMILFTAFCCGITVGFTHLVTSVGTLPDESLIPDWLSSYGHLLKSRIDDIPFRNQRTNSIIAALITGDRTGIPEEITTAFRESGASHILALSGLHLGIIYGILSFLFSAIGHSQLSRKLRSILTIAVCGIYTVATGAGASITRAFLFILIGESASLTGRRRSTSTVLMASLFIQLTISPESSKDIGFQLSYAAMAGIAFIFPWLKGMWPEGKGGLMQRIWNSAAMSIACQLTTGPLAYLYFGTFPKYFILTNLLALPLTGLIIPSGLLVTVLHMAGICPPFLTDSVEFLTTLMTDILKVIAYSS